METLEQTTMRTDRFTIPSEIIEEILSRLPVKSILRFRSVSKPWLSLIHQTPLHSRHHRIGLFIFAFDHSTRKQHLFSAACDGGPVTLLLTTDGVSIAEAEHLNGLILFTSGKWLPDYDQALALVINPSTRNFFELPNPYTDRKGSSCYLFGFDESRNEHKILMIRQLGQPIRFEFMIFSMSTYSWRNINAEPPMLFYFTVSVCLNSVIHLICSDNLSFHILAFDLRTEMFSLINIPQLTGPPRVEDDPRIIKVNGCIGLVFDDYDRVVETNEMHIWILQDYENRVWVKEIIKFTQPWEELGCPLPEDSVSMDEIIFRSHNGSGDVTRLVYNMKSRCFKPLQFTSGHQFSVSETLKWGLVRSYVESMMPL